MGTKITHVPYRGSGPAFQALIAGQIDYVCDQTVGIVPSIQGGLVKGLVIASPERTPVLPNVPTWPPALPPAFSIGALICRTPFEDPRNASRRQRHRWG